MKTPDSLKPKVYRARDRRFLVVIYNDHEEMYDFHSSTTFKEITEDRKTPSDPNPEPHTRYDSAKLCQNSGMNEIHFSEAMRVHGLVCTCNKYEQYEKDTLPVGQKGCKCKLVNDDDREIQDLDIDYIELNKKD